MEKTNLLFVIDTLDMGGAEKSLVRLCSKLNPNQFNMTVLINSGHEGILADQLPNYVNRLYISRIKSLSFKKQYTHLLYRLSDFTAEHLYGKKSTKNSITRFILRKISEFEYGRFLNYISNLMTTYQYDLSIGFMEGDPTVIATHCINANKYITFYRYGKIIDFRKDKESFEKSEYLITLSKNLKEELVKEKKYAPNKILILHNTYDIENIIKLSKEYVPHKRDVLNIVSVGRLHPDKGQLEAIKAALILKEKDVSFNWYFVGLDKGDYAENCKKMVFEFDLEDQIIFTGIQKNPYKYIRIADIYVLPSRFESLGNTIVESMLLDKPVISTNTLGAQELIRHGQNGLLCGFSAEDIASEIIKLIKNENLRMQLINSTKETIKDIENELNKYIELFSS